MLASMLALTSLLALGPGASSATGEGPVAAPHGRRIAVVVGIGRYAGLPPDLGNAVGRDHARALAAALEQDARYDEVHLLVDDQATRAAIESLRLLSLPSRLTSADSLLVYFSGIGLGGDFGEPYLLPYDTDPQRIPETAVPALDFCGKLQAGVKAGSIVLITDASHPGQLGGLALIGPTARSWPESSGRFFALSATVGTEIPHTDTFGAHVVEGLRGRADVSGDLEVSAGELTRYVIDHVVKDSRDRNHPSEGGNADPGLVLAAVRPEVLNPPVAQPSPGPRRHLAGWASLGGAALLGGGSALFYLRGRELEPIYFGREEISDGRSWEEVESTYKADYWLHTGLFVGAGVLAASGGTLLLWPSASGPRLSLQARF
jgi:hypothetical protein